MEKTKRLTKKITETIFAEFTKGQDIRECKITVRDLWRAIKNTIINICGNTKETQKCFQKEILMAVGGDEDEKS